MLKGGQTEAKVSLTAAGPSEHTAGMDVGIHGGEEEPSWRRNSEKRESGHV